MARLRAVFLLGMTLGLLTGCGSSGGNGGGGTTPPPPSTGSLTITVSELPSGASASITVSGPSGYTASVTSTQTLQVAPGSYTVAASSVSAGNSNYYPAIASQSATVAVSTTASVTVDYATIIPKTTKAIDTAGKSSLTVSSDASTITMSTSSAVAVSLQPNDILASGIAPGAPNGLLVRILSVSTSGQTVTASVEPATLEQAIQQGTLQYSVTLDTTNTTSSAYLPRASSRSRRLPGSRRLSRSLAQPDATTAGACAGNPNTLKYPYPSVPLIKTGSSSLTLLGESDFCPTLSLKVDISGLSIVSASANASLGVHNAIGVEGTYYTEFAPEYDFPAITGPPIDVPIGLGPIVVTVQPTLTPFIGLSGSAYASAYAGITTDSTVSVGIAYANGVFTPSGSATPTVIQPSTSVDGQVSIKAYAGLKAGVLLYGTVTPYLSTDAYLKFEAGLNDSPCWSLTSGVEANVGISGKALGKDFDYPTAPLNLYSAPIAQSTGTCFAPVLSTISPTTAVAGSGQLTLAVTGSNFVPDSTVNWNGQALATTYVDTNDLTAVVPASDLATGGTFPVTVNSPDSPGGTSAPMNFTVSQVTVTVSPASVAVPTGGSQQFTATVAGTSNTAVNWSVNGIAGGNATVGTISAGGSYTAPATIPTPASVTIAATSQADLKTSASATVSIIDGNYSYVSFNLPDQNEDVLGLNDSGEIVSENGESGGYVYSNGSTSLIQFPGSFLSFVAGINNAHQIVGGYSTSGTDGQEFGFIYSNGAYSSFALPNSVSDVYFRGISDSGTVAGDYTDSYTGFSLTNGSATTIAFPGSLSTAVDGITESGTIFGIYVTANTGQVQNFTYMNGIYSPVIVPNPASSGYVTGLNDSGDLVGTSNVGGSNTSFVYKSGVLSTIQFPGAYSTYARGINNNGQIAGIYTDGNGQSFGFIATPVK